MTKNKHPYSGKEISIVVNVPEECGSYLGHVSAKPVDLIRHLIGQNFIDTGW